MRPIGTILNEKDAHRFASYLKRKGIQNVCEISMDAASGHMSYQIWVQDEDKIEEGKVAFGQFQQKPSASEFDVPLTEQIREEETIVIPDEEAATRPRAAAHFTHFILALCAFIFFLNEFQEIPMLQEGIAEEMFAITPIQAGMLYDLPPVVEKLVEVIQKHKIPPNQKAEKLPDEVKAELAAIPRVPFWRGFYDWVLLKMKTGTGAEAEGSLFIKLRQGEAWRLISPCFLHAGFLHILFNMLWVWLLSRPIEQRLGIFRTLILTVVVGIGSNTAQYLMGGPFFVGYSGIVMGLAGFIWSRERIAPWEGYPLQNSTLWFLVLFVVAMFALQFVSFLLQLFSISNFEPNIANTAHIAGALIGAWLGRFRFFAWGASQ